MDIREAFRFCPRCAHEYDRTGPVSTCQNCGWQFFNSPAPGANILLVNEDGMILLGRRAAEPFKGKWELPGGFLEADESFEQAAVREMKEELGIDLDPASLQYLISFPDTYEYKGVIEPVVGPTFWARLPAGAQPAAHDDVTETKFFAPEEIPFDLLSSEPHEKAIRAFLALRSA
jgi:ADP-ribose pyrophosphatase YjhB (NUDIX family)